VADGSFAHQAGVEKQGFEDGKIAFETPCRLHRYDGPERDFPVLEPLLLDTGLMRKGTVGHAEIRMIDAMGLIETALDRLRFDPCFLTEFRGHST